MKVYLDTSILVAFFTADLLTGRAEAFLRRQTPILIVSDFAQAEFASAISRRVRMKQLAVGDANALFSNFDTWIARESGRAQATSADMAAATGFLRRLDLTLRTPDALHIAIAQRVGAELLTFDEKMANSARALGVSVLTG